MGRILDKLKTVYKLGNDLGVTSGLCQKYVRLSLEQLGFNCPSGLSAWQCYCYSVGTERITGHVLEKKKGWSNSELESLIGSDQFCLVYGFYTTSKYLKESEATIKTLTEGDQRRINLARNVHSDLINKGFDTNLITHTGVWTGNRFYNITSQGLIDYPSQSFVFVSWVNLTNRLNEIDKIIDQA